MNNETQPSRIAAAGEVSIICAPENKKKRKKKGNLCVSCCGDLNAVIIS